jgi:hypothetical protein
MSAVGAPVAVDRSDSAPSAAARRPVGVGDDDIEQVRGDGADRAQLVDGGQVDDAVA